MKTKRWIIGVIVVIMSLFFVTVAFAAGKGKSDLAKLRAATDRFHRTEAAQQAGWDLVPGLDHCFENPGVGAMGYHYINVDILDLTVNELQPEAMVYFTTRNGQRKLGAVEFIVPADAWDAAGNTEPPNAFGRSFHLNEPLGVYVLHAWIWRHNPMGMFEDWNPRVTCP